MQKLSGARIQVFTFKRGLLSRVAHDLRLTPERFEVRTDGERVEGRFWPESLRVEGALKGGEIDPGALSESDKAEIERNVREKILRTDRYPEACFTGSAADHHVRGELELVGETQPIEFDVHEQDGKLSGEVELVPTRWGIKPFKALMGAIQLQDRVLVRFEARSLTADA